VSLDLPCLAAASFAGIRVSHLSHLVRSGPGGYPSRIARLSTATSADRLIAFLPMTAASYRPMRQSLLNLESPVEVNCRCL
jgi:hypothetical protein